MSVVMEPSPVKFSHLPKRALLLGLTAPQLACLAVAAVTVIAAIYTGGTTAIAITAPVWGAATALAFVSVAGRRLIDWAPITIGWVWRKQRGQHIYLKRLTATRPTGTLALPGDAAALRQWVDVETGTVTVHDPHAATLTAVIAVAHPSFTLRDPAEQERRVQAWGRVLATCCRSGRIARLQVLERTLPDAGTGMTQWWQSRGRDDGGWAATVYREMIEGAAPASEVHATTISLALDLKAASRAIKAAGSGMRGAAAVLKGEMHTLATALRAAELNPSRWLEPHQLALMLRTAYDPAAAVMLERSGLGQDLADAGPMALVEEWDAIRTDTAYHAVLWINAWPRALVFPDFLGPVLMPAGIRRSFSLTVTPVPAAKAAGDLARRKTEHIANMGHRARIGQIEDAATTAEYHDALRQEQELTQGHGVVRYTGLIAVTADNPDELQAAVAAIKQAAIQASCETREMYEQAQAFTAAALPLCRDL